MTITYAGRTGHTPRVVNRPVNGPLMESPSHRSAQVRPRRPGPTRPAGAPMRYRGTGVATSSAPHRRRPVSVVTTVGLALAAGVITLWLGLVANFGSTTGDSADASARVPDSLAVVRVEPGESLQDVAARVAPHAPARQVAERIRELNALDTTALAAGQTLIAPVG